MKNTQTKTAAFQSVIENYQGEYREIPENPGYIAFDNGQVYSIRSKKFLKLANHHAGYLFVGRLNMNGVKRLRLIHEVIAYAFHGDRPEGMECNHIDHNKHNNCPENLEWVTKKDNMQHSFKQGKMTNLLNSVRKITPEQAIEIRQIRANLKMLTLKDIADRFGVSRNCINQIVHNVTFKQEAAQ